MGMFYKGTFQAGLGISQLANTGLSQAIQNIRHKQHAHLEHETRPIVSSGNSSKDKFDIEAKFFSRYK